MKRFLSISFATLSASIAFSQEFIYTKEGRAMLNRKQLIYNCLNALNKSKNDKTALAICECQTDKLNKRFTNKQFKKYSDGRTIDLNGLIKEDSLVQKDMEECYASSGKTVLLQAESFEEQFLSSCMDRIWSSSEKTLDSNRVRSFCACQLQLVKARQLSDAEMKTLSNPNSVLFYEMIYKCGDPFAVKEPLQRNWTSDAATDIKGAVTDTVSVLTINGMTYVKVKIGSSIQVWLLDTGASDLLINSEMESQLKSENIINESNYLGTGEYELANGTIDTCRKYRINNVQIGGFVVDNVLLAVTDKGKRIIVGKTLLNKFRRWSLNNELNQLILSKE